MLRFWTDFADGAVMFPLGIAVGVTLLLLRQWRAAAAWSVAIGCVWALMLVLKFLGYVIEGLSPGSPLEMIDLVTPSGHVASAAAIYGGLVGLVLGRPGALRLQSPLAATVVAAVIGLTRVLLNDHSVAEVITGAAVGIAGAYGLAAIAAPVARPARLTLVAVAALVIVFCHGGHLNWEQTIHQLGAGAVDRVRGSA